MTTMQINGSETATFRLFHLDLPPEAVERFTTMAGTGEWPLKYGLGATKLRPAFVDVVDIRDLGDMPLSKYLAEAHNASGSDFKQMKPRIDALRGHVVVLPSQAFDNTSQTLTIASPLRWIGTFHEEEGKARGPKLRSKSAQGTLTGPDANDPPGSTNTLKLVLAALALLILAVLAFALL